MGTGFRRRLGSGKGLERQHFGDIKDIESLPFSKSIISTTAKGRISPPATPDIVSSVRSRQTSTDNSEVAQEIVVWTEEMDIDSASQQESDDSSELSILEE